MRTIIFAAHRFPGAKLLTAIGIAFLMLAMPAHARADTIALQDFLFNINGTSYCPDSVCTTPLPTSGLNTAGFDFSTGLGTIVLTIDALTSGTYFLDVFLDHELHAPFYNEYGAVSGAPGAGVSWQIDEPGFGDGNRLGTIFDNAMANTLDNTNYLPGNLSNFSGDCGANGGGAVNSSCNNDVSMALGFNLALSAGEEAIITLVASQVAPTGGFYLAQFDPDSRNNNIYLSESISVKSVPEPGTLVLLGTGLTMLGYRRLRSKPEVIQ